MTQPTPDERDLVKEHVNVHDTGPSESDEMDVLSALYEYDEGIGVFYESKFDSDEGDDD